MKRSMNEADLLNDAKAVADAVLIAAGSGGLKNFMPYWQDRITEAAIKAMTSQERRA